MSLRTAEFRFNEHGSDTIETAIGSVLIPFKDVKLVAVIPHIDEQNFGEKLNPEVKMALGMADDLLPHLKVGVSI